MSSVRPRPDVDLPAGSAAVVQAIRGRVAERAADWFPDVGTAPRIGLRLLADRPRAQLYAVHIGEQSGRPQVLAKVRRDWPGGLSTRRPGARPRLASNFLSASEQTGLEFHGLSSIHAMIGSSHPLFGAVRPLDQLGDENTVLMEYVEAGTLRDLIVARSRFSPSRYLPGRRPAADLWRNVGVWMRLFQQTMPREGLPVRQEERDAVVQQFLAYDDFLTRTLGRRAVGDAARRGAEVAAAVLPPRLPVAVGHGDYAPRNVFIATDGRLTVFDPMPRWAVPRFEDVCRFLVGSRLHGLPLHTHGLSDGAAELDRREVELIDGYRGHGRLPMAQFRCYQLLITLDKWSALVDSVSGRPVKRWTRPRDVSLLAASGYVRKESNRLLGLAESDR